MPSPIAILALVLAFVANGFYWHAKGANGADAHWKAKINQERADAQAAARETEQRHQEAANAITKRHAADVQTVRRNLDIALDSLRSRPERPAGMPEAARTDCQGGTGAELSRPDAEFLSREAARADDIRIGLQTCYAHIDAALR